MDLFLLSILHRILGTEYNISLAQVQSPSNTFGETCESPALCVESEGHVEGEKKITRY